MADDEAITRGRGNGLADLSYAEAGERQTKLRPAHTADRLIVRQRLNWVTAAERPAMTQSKVSAFANYKLDGLSIERLMTRLTALDQDVDIMICNKPRSRAAREIDVAATGGGRGA